MAGHIYDFKTHGCSFVSLFGRFCEILKFRLSRGLDKERFRGEGRGQIDNRGNFLCYSLVTIELIDASSHA
jgi:hypothetical protein